MKIKILNDVYDIANRIKFIDKGYFIVFNTSKKNFEIHNSKQIDSTFCLTLPFKTLDIRALKYVFETQSKNIEKILNRIETENKLTENAEKRGVLSQFNSSIEQNLRR